MASTSAKSFGHQWIFTQLLQFHSAEAAIILHNCWLLKCRHEQPLWLTSLLNPVLVAHVS